MVDDYYGNVDLFRDDPVVARSVLPAPAPPPLPATLIQTKRLTIRESDTDVATGIFIDMGDQFEITATGQIHPALPAFLWPAVGPAGKSNEIAYDINYPLAAHPDAHPYCLLGKLSKFGSYFYVGAHFGPWQYIHDYPWRKKRELFLRINDNAPGGGSGQFDCTINLWSVPPQ
jgi:hypothetical protein